MNQTPTGNRIAAVVEGGVYLEQQDQAPPEIDCTLERVATTLHGFTAQGSPSSFPIGPTLQAQVELEGVTVTALLDTGSPVTIASFEFVLRALAAKRPSSQTKEDWKAEMKSRVEKSTINLCNFGGGRLDVIGQMIVSITRGNYQTKAVILVQDKTPLNLLVGTDLLATLGFVLIEKQAGRSARELAGPTRWSTIDVETAPTNQENLTSQQQLHVHVPANEQDRPPEPTAVVRLLNAVKIPARHQKIVKAQINKQYVATRGLFEPIPEFASEMGLTIAEAFVEPDGEHCINLILENMDLKATEVEPGKILGTVASAEMQGPPPDAEVSAEPPGDVPEDVTLAQLERKREFRGFSSNFA